ncbi:MAG: MFS transporter [Candidatus Protistobacter heckmanni]|nr:MFS transporter [Candidatus Protistobacter heckmanni]
MNQFRLLGQRRFAPFFWTQFCGALNDNVFKVGFTTLATFHAQAYAGGVAGTAFLISALFILPFLLFSATSGQLADKFEKSALMRLVKNLEIAIMLVAVAGFLLPSLWVLYACVFLMGLHLTLFGPVNYTYLPQHLATHELAGGNALVETGTFIAILLGTIAGGLLASSSHTEASRVGALAVAPCLALALLGRWAVAGVPHSPPLTPEGAAGAVKVNWNPVTETLWNLRQASRNPTVLMGMVGISWLWFVGATFLTVLFPYARDVLRVWHEVVTVLLAAFSICIGAGSLLCEHASKGWVDLALVLAGAAGISLFGIGLVSATPGAREAFSAMSSRAGPMEFIGHAQGVHLFVDLFLMVLSGGLYSVPLYVLIQARSEPHLRARVVAANNILNTLFMIVSALLGLALSNAGHGRRRRCSC